MRQIKHNLSVQITTFQKKKKKKRKNNNKPPYKFLLHPLLIAERSAIAGDEASFFKLVEWSEQLRPVTSVWLGAVRRRVQIRLFTEQRV